MIFLRRILLGLCLIWAPIVTGSINVMDRFSFDRSLSIEIIRGYPYNYNSLDDHLTLGFFFRNQGAQRQLRMQLSGDFNTSREISVPAGETRRLFVYLPHFTNPSFQVVFTDKVTGIRSPPWHLGVSGGFSSSVNRPHYILARLGSFSVPINVLGAWNDMGRIDTADKMPDHWRGLTGVTAIVVEYDYFLSNHPWKQTLIDWVTMGGILLVTTANKPTDDLEPLWKPLPFANAFVDFEVGALKDFLPSQKHIKEAPHVWSKFMPVGLGHIAVIPNSLLANIDTDFLQQIGIQPPSVNEHQTISQKTTDFLQQVLPDIGQVPRWTLFLILLGFALLIGPLGWIYLVKKKGRPFSYLIFVMVAAGVFSGSMLVATFLADGVAPKGIASSLRCLDLRTDTQITMEQVAVFVPTQYDSTIRIPTGGSVLLFPLRTDPRRVWNYTMKVDTAWETLEGIIPVRQRRLIGTRNLSRTQGRLVFTSEENSLRVENHLHGALNALRVWQDGHYYSFGAIDRGEAAIAQPVEAPTPSLSLSFSSQLMTEGTTLFNRLRRGELGTRYFIGEFQSADKERFLFSEFRDIGRGQHLVVGVY